MDTTRRQFLKIGAFAGASAFGAAALAGCAPQGVGSSQAGSAIEVDTIAWDGYYDVVVVGFGLAGAASALSASDNGATVLVADKAPEGHEGGNSRYCAQLFVSVNDKAKGLEHYQALRGDFYTPDDVLEAYVDGMYAIKDTVAGWGGNADEMVDLTDKKISNLTVEYPELPGAEAIRTNLVHSTIMDAELWRVHKKSVVDRKDQIDCWYESPATSLIQDAATKAIVGVEFKRGGKSVNIAAKNGVVMALGGFENNLFYMQQHTGYTNALPIGTLYNEGDGIRMCEAVGAKMWHMGSWESNGCGLIQQEDRVRNTGTIGFFFYGSVILVGGDARRYIAEDLEQRHGHVEIGGSWVMPARPERNIYVFDEAHREQNMPGALTVGKPFKSWSDDWSKEIEQGRLIKADTLAELAEKLSLDADTLQQSIDVFNTCAASGFDQYGRAAATMTAFGDGPYYAMDVVPSVLNTQGGPERTASGEIIDSKDSPIPHLYSAGEFGGVTANLYQGGGNIAECIVFGKISGASAAADKSDAFEIDASGLQYVVGSGDISLYDQAPDDSSLSSTEAVGIGEGLGGPIWVKISGSSTKIDSVEVIHNTETEGVGTVAVSEIPAAIVAAGSPEIDVVSGATLSSKGIIQAVLDAQSKLKA